MSAKLFHTFELKTSNNKSAIMTIYPNIAQGLEEIGRRPSEEIDLGKAALMLARVSRPGTKIAPYLRHFENLATAVSEYAGGAIDVSTQHEALVQVIYRRFGYTGTSQVLDTLDAANLMRAIDRRTGLSVTLGIIYISVAQKLGWSACGINFPGRFLVSLEAGRNRRIIDPFEQGHALIDLAASVTFAGYEGVCIDEYLISDGRHLISVQVNEDTPEGAIMKKLEHDFKHGKPLPSSAQLVENIAEKYGEQ